MPISGGASAVCCLFGHCLGVVGGSICCFITGFVIAGSGVARGVCFRPVRFVCDDWCGGSLA